VKAGDEVCATSPAWIPTFLATVFLESVFLSLDVKHL
jgi:hypothetical protein